MEQNSTDDRSGRRKIWLIIFCVSLFVLAILWSVDPSIFYLLTGMAAFSFYKILQNRNINREEPVYEHTHRQTSYGKPSFWDELRDLSRQAPYDKRKKTKLLSFIIAGFVGLVLFMIILSAIFSDGSATDASQARQRANDYYSREVYDTAVYFFGQAIQNDPENADIYLERGNAFLNSNKADSALLDYDKAILLNPGYKEAYYNKGLIYYNRKQYRNSINQTKKAVEIDPAYSDAMLLIGDDFYNSSQLDSAMVWYEGAYSNGYRSAALSHIMAYIYDTKGNMQRAIPLYKEAISYDTTRTEIYTRLGELVTGEEGNMYRQKAARYQRQ